MTTYSRVEHGSHGENIPWVGLKSAERTADHVRLPWSPTPLNPFKLSRDSKPYLTASLETIDRVLDGVLETPMAKDAPDYVQQLMPSSVRGALLRRFYGAHAKVASDHTPLELFDKAEMGSASPEESIALLELDPAISSVELAKLSHPYQWESAEHMDMDKAVVNALETFGFQASEDPAVRYILAGVDDIQDLHAVNMVRKVDLGIIDGVNGPMNVVKRDSYLLDLAADIDGFADVRKECQRFVNGIYRENPKFGGKTVRYDHGHNRLPNVVEAGIRNSADYLYPAVSSYYVHTI